MAPKEIHKTKRAKAMALVIVLALVALLSGLVVAYFSRSITARRLSSSSFHQARADELARSALEIISANLKQEVLNSTVPVRNGTPPLASGTYPIPTLLRISTAQPIAPPGVDYPASSATTTTPSANGRSVTRARWNQHYLIPRDLTKYIPSTKLGTEPIPAFSAPQWVFVTDQGTIQSPAPNRSVLGRYAYAIYDESALLDVNAAGYPNPPGIIPSSYSLMYSRKGSIAFADLMALGISASTGINNLVGWRNYASLQPNGTLTGNFGFTLAQGTNYVDLVLSNTTGFLKVSRSLRSVSGQVYTDQAFLSRQELIRFSRATTGSIIPQDALQSLGTFSRAVTMPSWSPPAALKCDENPDLLALRFPKAATVTHYPDNGSATSATSYRVNAGEPFLQRRFSLARLAWLTFTGTAPAVSPEVIQACFGLQWVGSGTAAGWNYVGASGTALQPMIKTLKAVSSESREPNFFELLQAGILKTSLTGTNPQKDIIQIGANIIDQASSSSQPTRIAFQDEGAICEGRRNATPLVVAQSPAFRSVGELGYAYCESTGTNTLDLCSPTAYDAGLLDLFTINDNEPPVVAGQINPTNAPGLALKAILQGALVSGTSTLGSGTAMAIATAFMVRSGTNPIANRADLALALDEALSNPKVHAFPDTASREAPLRALAPVTNTRTWNLMIDVIAQSGVFPPNAKTLDNFVVQGERRYWLHIAIDRFTGKVIDRQVEPVDQ